MPEGERCKVYDYGRVLDPNCVFVPSYDSHLAEASLMFSPNVTSV